MRSWWLAMLLVGMASAAVAQTREAPASSPGTDPVARAEATTVAPRPAAPRRARVRAAVKPPPLQVTKEAAWPQPPRGPNLQAGALAPMPNRNLEAPQVIVQDRTSLGPSIINRNLPGRSLAADGAPDVLEDKLFRPAPGARLNVPFSY